MRLSVLVCSIALLSATVPGFSRPAQSPRRLALLIGIDDYIAVRPLKGCVNDVERFKSTLVGKFGFDAATIVTLRNAQATRAGILAAFETLISQAAAGDTVLIHYSGHGSRQQDVSNDEDDGWDETLVPHDSRQGTVFDISDDELNGILARITAKTPNVTVVLDSCHSGSATRGGAEVRRVRDDFRRPPPQQGAPASRGAEGVDDFRPKDAVYALITGSRPNELSNEFDVDGLRQGALTYFLTRALMAAPPGATYRSIMEAVSVNVTNAFPSQHPQLEGAGDRVLFDVKQVLSQPYFLVHPQGAGARIEGGRLMGLSIGSELNVYPPGTLTFTGPPAARVRVTGGSTSLASDAEILSGGPIPSAARAVVKTRTFPDARLKVFFVPPETPLLADARKALAAISGVEVVKDETQADFRVRHERNLIFTEGADLVQLSPAIPADAGDTMSRLVNRTSTWMRWFAVLRLDSADGTLPAAITVGDVSRTRFTSGDRVVVTVTNLSSQPAFLTLLDLDADGGIAPLARPEDRTDPIPPSGKRERTIQLTAPADRPFVPDVLKAILTTTPVDPAIFTQAAARSGDPAAAARKSPFEQLMSQTVVGQSRAATVVDTVTWGSATARVETWQPRVITPPQAGGLPATPRLDGFILHFAEASRMSPGSVASRGLEECRPSGPQQDACWTMTPLGPSSSAIELRAGGRSGDSRAPRSMGAAWDEAARLQSATGAEFVEPVFELPLDDTAIEPSRSGGGTPDKEAARKDPEWSLKHVNAFAAREQLRRDLKRPADAEGSGIIVAHPDTGYRQHPEFWNSDPLKSAVMFESGWNFVEENDRPLDPLQDGTLANPGHGTKSGSVIVSAPGKQWTGGAATEFVTGVAPGARLVPLRVHTSVVHFNPSRLAQAINHAAEPDGKKIRLPSGDSISVISISMGGLPSLGLYRAVRNAEKHGVILIAAAGNQVRTVVWPARFESAIAVAATNVECGTWPGSSRGSAVDVAAPGESVWHANVTSAGDNGISLGQGTTYATATTAGVAALWVARYASDPLFAKLKKDGTLTEAFRAALQKAVWRPQGTGTFAPPPSVTCATNLVWDPSKYGAGIIDASRVLRQPPSEPPASRALGAEPLYPLFQSLFDSSVPSTTVEERLSALFPGTLPTALVPIQAEVTTLYAIDPDVQIAMEPVVGREPPSAAAFASARKVLLQKDVSTALAAAARRAQ